MQSPDWIDVVVTAIEREAPLVSAIRLEREHGAPLPSWQAGAHVKVRLPDGDTRSYSLTGFSADPAATTRPGAYLLGVRLEEGGKGGSRFMHGLAVGDRLSISVPANNFPLEPDAAPVVLVAGGIGVTPIAAMAAALAAADHPYRVIYAGRARDQLAFREPLAALAGDRAQIHCDDESGPFDLTGLMAGLTGGESLYVCGPTPMIETAIAQAEALHWAPGRLRFELFAGAAGKVDDGSFELVLKSSGRSLTVPADRTILDVLIEAGLDPLYDCRLGDCGLCRCDVIEGTPDHRDYVLTSGEKASGKVIQTCVSRSLTPRLVLDL